MEYTKEEIEIMKRAVIDYEVLEKEVNRRITEGATITDLYDYIRHLSSCDITSYEIDDRLEYQFFDFNYCDMCCTIIEGKKYDVKLHLSKSIELWNDNGTYLIDATLEIDDVKRIIEESEEK